jgi:transglutaminase-like putative cysteine protease
VKRAALGLLLAGMAAAADQAPPWLREAAAVATPQYAQGSPGVVLAQEEDVAVEDGGRIVATTRFAVRILTAEGRSAAAAYKVYLTGTARFREIRAWLIHPSGAVKRYGKDKTMDIAAAPNDVYNEVRVKAIVAASDADPGSVFGYEAVVEDRAMFLQSDFLFQGRLPAVRSRFSTSLPAGWRCESVTFNAAPIAPRVVGETSVWELRDLPPIRADEAASPAVTALAPRIAVTFTPPDGARTGSARAFARWKEVSRWLAELAEPLAVSSPELEEKARALAANAKTDIEKAEAIGRFVQSVNYVSIQTGVGRGGGYRPHPAASVFAKAYGDCKDKANLMRVMLRAVGMDARLVAIHSGDRTYVREAWPSAQQFNHMILAIQLKHEPAAAPGGSEYGALLRHETLGRLLMFDPTDPYTPFGYLPEHEQDSFALPIVLEGADLLRMPVTPPSATRLQRETSLTLGEMGDITASIREVSTGEAAARARRLFRRSSAAAFRGTMERWVTAGVKSAKVTKIEPQDSPAGFRLELEFSAPQYGQSMQRRLLVFKPVVISRRDAPRFAAAARRYPVLLNSEAYVETVRVKLPAGYKVDEKPADANLEAPFGKYRAVYSVAEGELRLTRSIEVRAVTVPASEYGKLRDFYRSIQEAEGEPVVLVRQ